MVAVRTELIHVSAENCAWHSRSSRFMIAVTKGSYFFPPSSSVRKVLCRKGSQGSPSWFESIRGTGEEPYGIRIWPAVQPKSRAHVFSVLPELTGFSSLPCFHRINLWSPELIGNAEVDPDQLPVDKTPRWSCALWPLRSTTSRNKCSLPCKAVVASLLLGLGHGEHQAEKETSVN